MPNALAPRMHQPGQQHEPLRLSIPSIKIAFTEYLADCLDYVVCQRDFNFRQFVDPKCWFSDNNPY